MTTYIEAVTEARQLVKRSEADQWRLAELTWEQVKAGKSRTRWAEDIDVHRSTTARWYLIWERWGSVALRDRPSFSDAFAQAQDSTAQDAADHHQIKALGAVRNLPPERKAEVARELLNEPEVAAQVVDDPTTRIAIHGALDERYDRVPKPYPARPDVPGSEPFELLSEFRKLHIGMDRIVQLVTSGRAVVNNNERDALLKEIAWLRAALDHTESGLNAGSLDEALRAFQEEWL